MYTLDESTTIYSDADKTETNSDVELSYNEAVHVLGVNDDTVMLDIDGDEYYASTEDLSYFRYIEEEEAYNQYYNENFYNTNSINTLNTYYNPDIADSFYINNDKLRELVQEYLDKAASQAGEDATPAEIVYYAYIALMDNSYYSYNNYCAEVKKRYGLDDNSGSYRAAAILDSEICRGACENYACAMTAFLRTMGFDAEIVGGKIGSKGHYWCQVGDLIFDAQVDDSNKTYGLRFGRTNSELVSMGYSSYTLSETKNNTSILSLYNNFGT
jgi:transglutaminase-like putative cysteine protease